MSGEIIYEINGLSYLYAGRFPALKNVGLAVRKGERIALLGANGSGKSTLLLALAGLVFPAAGSIRFGGIRLTEDTFNDEKFRQNFRGRVGIVFQNSDVQLFNSNVDDELMFGLSQLDIPKDEARRRMREYMELMDIAKLKERHPQNMSVGEKKRVAIASVLVMQPEILLLDEPTAGLDPRTSRHLIDAIISFGKIGRTVITSTQDIHIVAEIADRVVVMGEDKRIVKDAPAADVLNDASFLAEHNLIHVHAHKHGVASPHVHSHEHPDHHHTHGSSHT